MMLGRVAMMGSAGVVPSGTLWKAAVVAAGGSVSAARLTLIQNVYTGIAGLPIDALWLTAGENAQSATIDLISQIVATPVSGPTFTTDRGYTTSATAYLNLGTHGGANYTQNGAMFGNAQRTDTGAATFNSMGSINTNTAALCEMYLHYTDGGIYSGVNAVNAVSFGTGQSSTIGIHLLSRTDANTTTLYKNAVQVFLWAAIASNGLPNQNFCLGGSFDSSGTFSSGAAVTQQFSFAVIGGAMNATQVTTLNTTIQTYLTAVGA